MAATGTDEAGSLLGRTRLQPSTEHRFPVRVAEAVGRARLDIYPDGGLSRLRVLGEITPAARDRIAARWLHLLPDDQSPPVDPGVFFT